MPNQRKAIFMASSMPNRAMKAGRKAVMGMDRMGSAMGFTRSCSQLKPPISRPSGRATTAAQKKAWAMRHQLWKTLPSRSYSVHRRPKAVNTPSGSGTENGGSNFQRVRRYQKTTTRVQAHQRQNHPRLAGGLAADIEQLGEFHGLAGFG